MLFAIPRVQSLLRENGKIEIELEEKEDELNKLKNATSKLEENYCFGTACRPRRIQCKSTKVVHLTMNPAATEATAQEHNKLKGLEQEILRLKSNNKQRQIKN